jgi:hypothetical protein
MLEVQQYLTSNYIRDLVIKTTWCLHKNRHENQLDRLENPDTNPCNYSHLSFDKGAQNMHWRKDSHFKNGAGETDFHL